MATRASRAPARQAFGSSVIDETGRVVFSEIEFIAKGGYGETYKAIETATGAPVVLKRFLKKGKAGYEQESKALDQVADYCMDKHILCPRDHFVYEQHDVLITPFIAGESLFDYLFRPSSRTRGLPETRPTIPFLTEFLIQVGEAVETLHTLGMAHCDIKLENIMVSTATSVPTFTLIDLGLAVVDEAGARQVDPTRFSSFERNLLSSSLIRQFEKSQHATVRLLQASDWTALGMTYYTLVTGVRAEETERPETVFLPPRAVPNEHRAAFEAMTKRPDDEQGMMKALDAVRQAKQVPPHRFINTPVEPYPVPTVSPLPSWGNNMQSLLPVLRVTTWKQ
jgi:serine/threonine protein kinase